MMMRKTTNVALWQGRREKSTAGCELSICQEITAALLGAGL